MKFDRKRHLGVLIERFKRYNRDFIIFIMLFIIFSMNSTISELVEKDSKKDDFIKETSQYVTYVSDGGVIKQYERETFDVYSQKINVAKALSDYLIQSRYALTDGYKNNFFQSDVVLYEKAEPLQIFYKNYIAVGEDATAQQIKSAQQGLREFEQIITYFRLAIHDYRLPDIIEKKFSSTNFLSWKTNGAEFEISFEVPLYIRGTNKNNYVQEGEGMARITAKGYFNLFDTTSLNPSGMKFSSLSLKHPENNNNLRGEQ